MGLEVSSSPASILTRLKLITSIRDEVEKSLAKSAGFQDWDPQQRQVYVVSTEMLKAPAEQKTGPQVLSLCVLELAHKKTVARISVHMQLALTAPLHRGL